MCGIIGAAAKRNVSSILIKGLHQMEYRGYDSAGLCVYSNDHELQVNRVKGRVKNLEDKLKDSPFAGNIGIAHTRWATHGTPTEENAHPIISNNQYVVVHNGIIENYAPLRKDLINHGYHFKTETDTEVIAHLLHLKDTQGTYTNFREVVKEVVGLLRGSYALAIFSVKEPNKIYAVRAGCPLVLGVGIEENFVASDQLALLPVTNQFIFLEDGDWAEISHDYADIYDRHNNKVIRKVVTSTFAMSSTELGEYRHFMQKEIAEQPSVMSDTLLGNITDTVVLDTTFGATSAEVFDKTKAIQFVACGSSYHAAMVAKYWIEKWAGIPCFVSIASEYRMQKPVVIDNTLLVLISQSGETADTLSALKLAKNYNYLSTLAICNVSHSTLAREADLVMNTRAGVEIGVASTKAFMTQLLALLMLSVCLAKRSSKHHDSAELSFDEEKLVHELKALPRLLTASLEIEETIKQFAHAFIEKQHTLFLGRGPMYPIAMEGALKLKEISYIHAESYPAGELKHGPLALIDEKMPVVALVADGDYKEKMLANLEEVKSRCGELFIFTEESVTDDFSKLTDHVCYLPSTGELLKPLIYTIPMQLLAYHIAVLRGTDIDKPRNLAKSVTVE
jgi:glucosamine--fructose-6-phosphate aminotransferase (isomerizing)